MSKFEMTVNGNELLKADGFSISYRSAKSSAALWGSTTSGFSPDCGGDETAIINDGKYFILNGDFRCAYIAIVDGGGGADECLAFFHKKETEHRSTWTSCKENEDAE